MFICTFSRLDLLNHIQEYRLTKLPFFFVVHIVKTINNFVENVLQKWLQQIQWLP